MQVYRREAHGATAFREQQVDAQPLLVRGTLRIYYGTAPGSKYLKENESITMQKLSFQRWELL